MVKCNILDLPLPPSVVCLPTKAKIIVWEKYLPQTRLTYSYNKILIIKECRNTECAISW